MGKCKLGNCYVEKENKKCCAECDKARNCLYVCWLTPGVRNVDFKKCVDYIETE